MGGGVRLAAVELQLGGGHIAPEILRRHEGIAALLRQYFQHRGRHGVIGSAPIADIVLAAAVQLGAHLMPLRLHRALFGQDGLHLRVSKGIYCVRVSPVSQVTRTTSSRAVSVVARPAGWAASLNVSAMALSA